MWKTSYFKLVRAFFNIFIRLTGIYTLHLSFIVTIFLYVLNHGKHNLNVYIRDNIFICHNNNDIINNVMFKFKLNFLSLSIIDIYWKRGTVKLSPPLPPTPGRIRVNHPSVAGYLPIGVASVPQRVSHHLACKHEHIIAIRIKVEQVIWYLQVNCLILLSLEMA